jgi:hypothetical protein
MGMDRKGKFSRTNDTEGRTEKKNQNRKYVLQKEYRKITTTKRNRKSQERVTKWMVTNF